MAADGATQMGPKPIWIVIFRIFDRIVCAPPPGSIRIASLSHKIPQEHRLAVVKWIYSGIGDGHEGFKKIAPSADIQTCSVRSQGNCAAWGPL
jgi:hypothetical protein